MKQNMRDMIEKPLEEEIWAPTPDDLGIHVSGLANAMTKGMGEQLAPFDISPLEFTVLGICLRSGTTTASQLARVMPIDAGRISRIVNALCERGLLTRQRLREDRRVVRLRLTEAGQRLATELAQRVQEYNTLLVEKVSQKDLATFVAVSWKIMGNYARYEKKAAAEKQEER